MVSERVDALFENSAASTKTETERAFQQGFVSASGAILTAMNVMSFLSMLQRRQNKFSKTIVYKGANIFSAF